VESPIVLYISQVILFSAFPFLFGTVRSVFRANLFYVYLAIVLTVGGFIGQVWAVHLTETIRISGGNIAYAAFMMAAILFVVLEDDLAVARNVMGLVIVVNLFNYQLFNSTAFFWPTRISSTHFPLHRWCFLVPA